MAKSGIYKYRDGKLVRTSFPFYDSWLEFYQDRVQEFTNSETDNNSDMLCFLKFFNSFLNYAMEKITLEDLMKDANNDRLYISFLKQASPIILDYIEKTKIGKNNYPLDKIKNGNEVKEWLSKKFNNDFSFTPKQIQNIAKKLEEENESIDFLEYAYNDLQNRKDTKDGKEYDIKAICKMFAGQNIFDEDFLVKYRQLKLPKDSLSEKSVIDYNYMTNNEIDNSNVLF